jgi:hypothetical protein
MKNLFNKIKQLFRPIPPIEIQTRSELGQMMKAAQDRFEAKKRGEENRTLARELINAKQKLS